MQANLSSDAGSSDVFMDSSEPTQGCDHIYYSRDQLLSSREVVEIPQGILKIKQEFEAEIKAAEKLVAWRAKGAQLKECKAYLVGGCEFGSTCIFVHDRHRQEKTETEQVKLNSSGLPLRPRPVPSTQSDLTANTGCLVQQEQIEYPQRPGELECLYFLKFGTCRFRSACRFHHPLPSALGDPTMDRDDDAYHQEKMEETMEYFERPGEAECPSFMEFGICNFGATCKHHHPKDRLPSMASCNISPSPIGLPLKPGKAICSSYNHLGICKNGPACEFDHSTDSDNSVPGAESKSVHGSLTKESEL